MIHFGFKRNQARFLGIADQAKRLPGHPESGFHLGTHRDIFHEPAQRVG